ncbi:type III-B CRISPR-associated protein Cas10/Cmr2 [Methylobacter tundripaludum]|uniref:CRISPR-associated protein, Crm2 family n=1 Tax=Methylobacter tundripaludum (strain ATCC BAA-1195 / DSM 17260 / SV96) TaxID=697282 RepID=G3IV70_METTV|nr:type III-B CRISPR-associated protein Cas10/Cmr2 [Methylobacter tundripaludum]EGW21683.1 CRISPR-associated protein, Crm2 family [Methylobacter tundripaludum SV96]
MSKTLHFNFTPVQSFVAQARRTRDLWAGSYLLAWLSGQAMNAILKDNGKILMPYIDDDSLMAAIQDPSHASDLAKSLGTLPNRFTAQIPENKDPKEYAKVIQDHWIKVANAVRDKIDPGKSLIDDDFWNRQINNHWEFAWVTGEKSSLDSRKNLRLPTPTEESGEKCTVCGERQELSESKKSEFVPNRKSSKDWWAKFQVSDLDLRENERLCAVCLTKRLFPLVAEKAIGWEVEQYYPSTAYLSAIDWLEKVLIKAKDSDAIQKAANELTETAKKLHLHNSEYNTHINGLSHHLKDSGINKPFIDLDGDAFYLSSIDADQLQKRGSNKTLSTGEKNDLRKALIKLQKAAGSKATPFYALLLMDGDGMGKLIGDCDTEERGKISKALADFTSRVPGIVDQHNGKLVYAGGDDVFALLPVSSAIKCAADCRSAYQQAYQQAFEHLPKGITEAATISAAVQFAHQNIALSVVVKDAHRLLDDIAKDRTGRDALTCRVWKPGGIVLTWAQPWTDELKTDFAQLLDEIIAAFRPDPTSDRFSSKFFYKLRDLFEQIESDDTITDEAIQDLLAAEYLANRELKKNDKETQRKEAKERVERLLLLCRQQTRHSENTPVTYTKGKYNADAALLVRFLVQKEV